MAKKLPPLYLARLPGILEIELSTPRGPRDPVDRQNERKVGSSFVIAIMVNIAALMVGTNMIGGMSHASADYSPFRFGTWEERALVALIAPQAGITTFI
jgi:hypothetical protein